MTSLHSVLLGLLTACTPPPDPAPEPPSTPLVRIGGSETMTRQLLPALVEAHTRSRGDLRFEVTAGGTGAGMRQLLAGTLDIAGASRRHRPSDEEQAVAQGFSLDAPGTRHILGMDVVAVVVHEDSPIESLTYDQVIGIFCERTIDDLQFLGDGFPARPLVPVARDPRSGTRTLFEDFFCGPRGIHAQVENLDTEGIRERLASDPGAIGFATMTERIGKVVALRAQPGAEAVAPSQKTIANGSYPLYHDLYLYTRGPAAGPAKAFVDWVLTPAGQDVVDEHRFVPIYHRTAEFDGPRPLRETVHFDAGSDVPNQRSMARIQLLVQELRQRKAKGQHIILEGFTDATEPDAIALSQSRADTVKDLLERQLDAPYFEIIPRGGVRPLAPNDTPFGRLRNRRVQIYLADEESGQVVVGQGDVIVPAAGTTP
jgi:phosphate transport system substrate-binding protein